MHSSLNIVTGSFKSQIRSMLNTFLNLYCSGSQPAVMVCRPPVVRGHQPGGLQARPNI